MALNTDLAIKNWKPSKPREVKPCGHRDGLYIRANASGEKTFYWRKGSFYRLGDYPSLTLSKARAMAAVCNEQAKLGVEPEAIIAALRGAGSLTDVASMDADAIAAAPRSLVRSKASSEGKPTFDRVFHDFYAAYAESNLQAGPSRKQPLSLRGSYVALWADIDEGEHPLSDVVSAVDCAADCDHAWLVYSTFSATNESPRWRVIIPLAEALTFERWEIAQKALASQLASRGIKIDVCAEKGAQVAILPMARPFYQTKANAEAEGLNIDGDWLFLAAYDRAEKVKAQEGQALKEAGEAARKRREERQAKAQRDGSESPIEWFNRQNSIADMLAECGYTHRGSSSPNWRSPYQTSGSYATRDFEDHWVSLSGSDAAEGIGAACAGGRYGDAFDLYAHFQHGGDFKAAVRAEGGSITESDIDVATIDLTPKMIAGRASFTRHLLATSTPKIDELVRRGLTQQIANAIDLAALEGSGTPPVPNPSLALRIRRVLRNEIPAPRLRYPVLGYPATGLIVGRCDAFSASSGPRGSACRSYRGA